ncbi:MAG TPA: GNAT family N-acetyltransferase [Salinimicrobium sp.]|nr:GNAT family N-acetyltransferase [Salinimicrobium sp.]
MTTKTIEFPELKTERLHLRQLCATDADVIYFLRSDAAVNFYIKRAPAKNREDAIEFINKVNTGFFGKPNKYWGITWGGRLVGTICLWNFSEDKKTAEIGYDLVPEFQRKGIMGEALKSVLDYGFQHLKLLKIEAFTHRKNESSINILNKNCFVLNPDRKDKDNADNLIFEKTVNLTP